MTGKGCKPAVYWLNAFVLDAATSDISSGNENGDPKVIMAGFRSPG
jgi:hypothetical protein